jgi:hypothetical protein
MIQEKEIDPFVEKELHKEIDDTDFPIVDEIILKDLTNEFKTNLELNKN